MDAIDYWLQGFGSGLLLCLVLFVVIWMLSRQVTRRAVRQVLEEMELLKKTEETTTPGDESAGSSE